MTPPDDRFARLRELVKAETSEVIDKYGRVLCLLHPTDPLVEEQIAILAALDAAEALATAVETEHRTIHWGEFDCPAPPCRQARAFRAAMEAR